MPTALAKDLRKLLERTTAAARVLAESACQAALENLAVHEKEYRSHMDREQRQLRNRLRARGKALGDLRDKSGRKTCATSKSWPPTSTGTGCCSPVFSPRIIY